MIDDPATLVSTEWLAARLTAPDLRILDASWYLPNAGRDPLEEYAKAHIPGARFVALDDVSDGRSSLPHMAPPLEKFMSRMRRLGVGDGHTIVVYDGAGLFSAARLWWLFRLFGQRAAVLDGGLPKWRAEGRPVTSEPPQIRDRHMTVTRHPELMRDVTEVARASKLGLAQIVDARAAARFRGEAPEPRPGLRAGHIPGSRNLPFGTLLNADGTMKDPGALRAAFAEAGVDLDRPIVTSCGSGVTAAILNLALARIGHTDHALYDGSWAEWGMYPDLKIATGDA
ncbi:3-mercaptopyruvate sulfurtransferase [Jannaschia seohaensis]|uniref:3-mercaptopyruvate sulfurtransferase n=1 Tax=Jannaschia seohaensis TaxID=475081 RepID=A0A2Y9B6Q1_9RHOB|nr:3-mercaptopyruvate sulfurtransferase [Jannaschia seohaensis]PWJ15060.1 thiosulfate/3-mercaptopyruvate sulfurtransferase [Jannaschia seohaensis]SSA49909.1 thiosulfate/3-mercaptopyruvate sulfurtransferase [Jannaschia seohaensis]